MPPFFILWRKKILIDPVLAPKGSWPPFPNSIRQAQNNLLVKLPVPVDELLKAGANQIVLFNWLFDFNPGHEPVELLPCQLFYFQLISGPAESALDFHTFIQQHKSVRFPEQSFDPVTTFSTEKIQGTSPWIHMELILTLPARLLLLL